MRVSLGMALGLGCFASTGLAAPPSADSKGVHADAESTGAISGVVNDRKGRPVEHALVLVQCSCLTSMLETQTNSSGIYVLRNLPPGHYTIQVLYQKANVSKIVTLPAGAKFHANFAIDPEAEFVRKIVVKPKAVHSDSSAHVTIDMNRAKNLPVGANGDRDFTAVVDLSPGSARDRASGESYRRVRANGWARTAKAPLSTFSIDVDTASYSNVRRFLNADSLPPEGAVRIEELLNYFHYDTPHVGPARPLVVGAEVGPSPWHQGNKLVRVTLRAKPVDVDRLPPRNLVFLLDVSGSMEAPDKLPLLQRSLDLLIAQLRPEDHVAIVVYAGAAGVVLEPSSGADQARIRSAIADLQAGGSTNGGEGIVRAYDLARRYFDADGINRVILGTDGDFNVGVSSEAALTGLIEHERESGVFLSVLGFGTGNLQDDRMEALADKGNGNYAYIDSLEEARKVLVTESGATMMTVAKDVKLQVEFNPNRVAGYRLVGYENRQLRARDFDDDEKDAGELGAGHDVTALYEIEPSGAIPERPRKRRFRYRNEPTPSAEAQSTELMSIKLRYKAPKGGKSRLARFVVHDRDVAMARTTDDFRFAVAVATFGYLLRGSREHGQASWSDVRALAEGARGSDPSGLRAEFLRLAEHAARLQGD